MVRILLADEEASSRSQIKPLLTGIYNVRTCIRLQEVHQYIEKDKPDIILFSTAGILKNIFDILGAIVAAHDAPPVIVISKNIEPNCIVRAIRLGAVDYLRKPVTKSQIMDAIGAAINTCRQNIPKAKPDEPIAGESRGVHALRKFIQLCAGTDAPVLLLGDTGTGKDLSARRIHQISRRHEAPFISVNCGAIPESLFESEMFGTEPGAYTGATKRRGAFERSHHGTLFLDEVGELSPYAQVKLLRAIEEKKITRVGGTHPIPTDIRIIGATNRDLHKMKEDGTFRDDLFYRLNVLFHRIPSLKDRREDIPALTWKILRQVGPDQTSFTNGAMDKLVEYSWPGNIRELHNCIQRAVLLMDGTTIRARDITFV